MPIEVHGLWRLLAPMRHALSYLGALAVRTVPYPLLLHLSITPPPNSTMVFEAPSSVPQANEVRHLPIICLTTKASPDDLRSYMVSGMDGCVSKPVECGPLLNTLRAAIPLHLSPASANGRPLELTEGCEGGPGSAITTIQGNKGLGVLKGSAAVAAEGMVLAGRRADNSAEGALQVQTDISTLKTKSRGGPHVYSRFQGFVVLVW